jgi:hypothetical protein
MASTFSPTLRIELIGDGDQSGIWGQTTNTNLGTLLEQAITGVVNITMTNADYTLSNFNGVSDESRNAVLVVGGTNAAVRDVIAPLVEKLYVIRNSTSGGFAINIRAATGSSVSVPSGATVWVYCDGTNFNAINTESVGNFEVNGNLTVTGNTNAVAATYTGNVSALNISTANVTATGAGAFTGNVSAANFTGAGLTITSINASNISAGTIANARTTAASANGASTIVARDSNGSFAANVGTFVTVSGAYSGNGAGLTDINASNISSGTISNARTTAASANGASTIVARDASGNFTANAITTTSISGNGVALTAINASNIASGTIANVRTTADSANGASTIVARDSSGNFTANAITTTSISGNGIALTAINASNVSSGTLAVARGGTGASTFTANSVVLGNGTSSLAGNMIAPGTSGNVLTSNGSTWTSASTQSVGVGQTWQAVTRTAGTPYTNSTGKPICFLMSFGAGSGATEIITLDIDGVSITFIVAVLVSGVVFGQNSIIIPTGATYSYTQLTSVGKSIYELR